MPNVKIFDVKEFSIEIWTIYRGRLNIAESFLQKKFRDIGTFGDMGKEIIFCSRTKNA
jgi:hypothetical protein